MGKSMQERRLQFFIKLPHKMSFTRNICVIILRINFIRTCCRLSISRIINIIFSRYLSSRCERFGDTFTNVVRTRQVLRRTFYLLAGKLLLRGNISKDCAKWDVKSFLRVQFSSTNCLLVVWSWTELTPSEHAPLTRTCCVYLCI